MSIKVKNIHLILSESDFNRLLALKYNLAAKHQRLYTWEDFFLHLAKRFK